LGLAPNRRRLEKEAAKLWDTGPFDRRRSRSDARSPDDEGQHAPTVLERIRACLRHRPSILRATDTPGRQWERTDALRMAARGAGPRLRSELPRLDFRHPLHH